MSGPHLISDLSSDLARVYLPDKYQGAFQYSLAIINIDQVYICAGRLVGAIKFSIPAFVGIACMKDELPIAVENTDFKIGHSA